MVDVKIEKIDQEKFTVTGKYRNIFTFSNLLAPHIKIVDR